MEFKLGGVVYVKMPTVEWTLYQKGWMDRWGRKAGLLDLGSLPAPTDEAGVGKFISDVVGRASEARVIVELLAGGLTKKGEKWSEKQAEANVPLLGDVVEEEALEALGLIIWDFLRSESALLETLLRYSTPPGIREIEASSLTPNPESPLPSPPDTESTTESPGLSLAMTPSDMNGWETGP